MKELTLEATIENIAQVTEFVNALLDADDCEIRTRRMIDIVIDELFSNIARYAYAPKTGMATVRVTMRQNPRAVEIAFVDSGVPYNPLTHEMPASDLSPKMRKAGGFGISIVKRSMDNFRYEYVDGCNVTTITKLY